MPFASLYSPRLLALALLAALSGCASLPADRGLGASLDLAAARGVSVPTDAPDTLTRDLLAEPLTAANAVSVALINNPDTRRVASELGLAAADIYDAGRLSNPVIGLSRLTTDDPSAVVAETSLSVALQFTDLLFLHRRSKIAKASLARTQHEVARAMQALAAQVEKDWLAVVAAEQGRAVQQQIAAAAQASAELAQRYFDAGNIPRRELALEQATAVEARIAAREAEAKVERTRATLSRSMGLPVSTRWSVVAGLALPDEPEPDVEALLEATHRQRLDLMAAEHAAESLASAHQLTRTTRLLDGVELGYSVTRETDNSRIEGPSLGFALPLFNWGSGRQARAEARLDAAEAQLAGLMLDAQTEVVAAHAQMTALRKQVDDYRNALIPLTDTVVEQMQREQNYMLIGIFELISAKRESYAVYHRYLDTLLAYWQTRVDLGLAVGRSLSAATPAEPEPELDLDPPTHHHPSQEDPS